MASDQDSVLDLGVRTRRWTVWCGWHGSKTGVNFLKWSYIKTNKKTTVFTLHWCIYLSFMTIIFHSCHFELILTRMQLMYWFIKRCSTVCTVAKHECLKHVQKWQLMFALWCCSAMCRETPVFPGTVLCYREKDGGSKQWWEQGTRRCEKEKRNQMTQYSMPHISKFSPKYVTSYISALNGHPPPPKKSWYVWANNNHYICLA